MRILLILIIVAINFFSCRTKTEISTNLESVKLLIPDTTNNKRALGDFRDINYHLKLENKIGLTDLKKGADSLEIRLWVSGALSDIEDLYVLKFQNTNCLLSYYRVYPRNINYDDENRNREWDPFNDPIIDSTVSKSVLVSNRNLKELHFDSIWLLKSQSELSIPDSIGFTDCDRYVIEISDKKRFKYLMYHCPMGYYKEIKLKEILTYMDFCEQIRTIAEKFKVIVPEHYE